jgi:hypothetical protein
VPPCTCGRPGLSGGCGLPAARGRVALIDAPARPPRPAAGGTIVVADGPPPSCPGDRRAPRPPSRRPGRSGEPGQGPQREHEADTVITAALATGRPRIAGRSTGSA